MHTVVVRDSDEVAPETSLMVEGNQLSALPGTEDDVEEGTDVTVWHGVPPAKSLPSAPALG
jgi:hypothetical protein